MTHKCTPVNQLIYSCNNNFHNPPGQHYRQSGLPKRNYSIGMGNHWESQMFPYKSWKSLKTFCPEYGAQDKHIHLEREGPKESWEPSHIRFHRLKVVFFLIVPRSLCVIVQIHQQKMGKDSLPGILEELWAHKNSQVIDLLFRIKCNPVIDNVRKQIIWGYTVSSSY